jgi:hypothetical protein
VIVFLGAGASAPFGYPTMIGLREELRKRAKADEADLLMYLLYLRGTNNDAETVLQDIEVIETISKRKLEKIFGMVTIPGSKTVPMGFDKFVSLCRSLRDTIEDLIFEIYQFRPECEPKFQLYEQLLSTLESIPGGREHYIYTTNYDRIIEELCSERKNYEIKDGFVPDPKSRRLFWQPMSFSSAATPNVVAVKLFKLHGSLNWKISQYGIEQVLLERRLTQPTPVYKKDVLVYPGGKEPPEEEPFRWLYERFETQMKETDRCLVIGFSFRDPYLNRIFRDFVNSGKGQLLTMSANCKEMVKDLLRLENIDALKKYVETGYYVPIPCHFGEGDWLERLHSALRVRPMSVRR